MDGDSTLLRVLQQVGHGVKKMEMSSRDGGLCFSLRPSPMDPDLLLIL